MCGRSWQWNGKYDAKPRSSSHAAWRCRVARKETRSRDRATASVWRSQDEAANLSGRSFTTMSPALRAAGKRNVSAVVERSETLAQAVRFDPWLYAKGGSPEIAALYDERANQQEFASLAGKPLHAGALT